MSPKKRRKDLRLQIEQTLTNTLVKLHGEISDKKIKRNVRRASKALLAGLKVPSEKKEAKKDKVETPAVAVK